MCLICEVQKNEDDFPDDGPICADCVAVLRRLYDVEYAPPVRQPRLQAYLNLVLAIRGMAETDDRLDEFEANWIESSPWNQIYAMVIDSRETMRLREEAENALSTDIDSW